jgi:hypothetical protein
VNVSDSFKDDGFTNEWIERTVFGDIADRGREGIDYEQDRKYSATDYYDQDYPGSA